MKSDSCIVSDSTLCTCVHQLDINLCVSYNCLALTCARSHTHTQSTHLSTGHLCAQRGQDVLNVERVCVCAAGAFQKWRRWAHDRHNSTHTHSPRHTHKSQHNSQHGSPSSPSRRREHRSSLRPALARDDGSASDAGGESATSPLRAAPSAPTAVAAADAAGAMVACDYGDGMRHFRELHEMLASMERLLAPAHKHSAGNTTHAPEYDQHQHPPAPIRNPDAISIQDGPMYSSMQQPPAQPPPPSQQLPWQARELPSYHVWGDLNLNTNSNVGVSGQARELPSYHSWGETSGRGDGYAARHSADGAPTLATHVAALLRRPATDGGDITSYYGGDGRTAGERVDPSWQSPVRATQSAGGAMAAAAAAGDAPVPRSPQLAAVQRRVQQLEQQVCRYIGLLAHLLA